LVQQNFSTNLKTVLCRSVCLLTFWPEWIKRGNENSKMQENRTS